jgi:hypothetical protein
VSGRASRIRVWAERRREPCDRIAGTAASLSADEVDVLAGLRLLDVRARLVFAMERKVRYAHRQCQAISKDVNLLTGVES